MLPADAASLLPSAPLSCDGDGRRGRSISRGRGLGQNVLRLRPRSTDLQQMQDGTGRCFPPPPLPLRPLLLRLCVCVCVCDTEQSWSPRSTGHCCRRNSSISSSRITWSSSGAAATSGSLPPGRTNWPKCPDTSTPDTG